jgi:hypothetical protein
MPIGGPITKFGQRTSTKATYPAQEHPWNGQQDGYGITGADRWFHQVPKCRSTLLLCGHNPDNKGIREQCQGTQPDKQSWEQKIEEPALSVQLLRVQTQQGMQGDLTSS